MNRTTTNNSGQQSARGRDREIAPTEEIHLDVGVSSLHPFSIFLLKKQQKLEAFLCCGGLRLGACCLTILIYIV